MDPFRLPFTGRRNFIGHFESDEKFLRCHIYSLADLETQDEKSRVFQWDGVTGITSEAQLIDEFGSLATEEEGSIASLLDFNGKARIVCKLRKEYNSGLAETPKTNLGGLTVTDKSADEFQLDKGKLITK